MAKNQPGKKCGNGHLERVPDTIHFNQSPENFSGLFYGIHIKK
jgi:hypothetical protein